MKRPIHNLRVPFYLLFLLFASLNVPNAHAVPTGTGGHEFPLGGDAGDNFDVDTDKLIVQGDTGNVGVGTFLPISFVQIGNSVEKGLLAMSLKLTAGKIFGLALILGACAPPPPPPVTYEITGNVKVTNDCDGQLASIPNHVTIETELMNSDGSIGVPGSAARLVDVD